MWRPVIAFLVLGLMLPTPTVPAPALPTAPDGFSWKRINKVRATFLIPDGWHFKEEASDKTLAYFLTAEEIKNGGTFDTGLTINVFKALKDKNAVEYAQVFRDEAARQHEALQKWELDAGAFRGFGVITRQTGRGDGPAQMVSYLVIGNERTNTLYLMWFESPESRWETEWKKGDRMLQQFTLDDEV